MKLKTVGDAELAAHRRREAHRRMKPRREAEPDPGLVDAPAHPFGPEIDHDAEGLKHVGRAGERRSRPPAVLADDRPCSGHDERARASRR